MSIVVDQLTREPIEVLPCREGKELDAYLLSNPQIQYVTRDRGRCFIEALNRCLPHATQISDRFHLMRNMTDVMAQKQTNQKYFDLIMDFAKEIRMIPLPVRKEKSGYLLNSMLVPLLFSGMDLYVNGISNPESIDKAWTLGTGAPKGPFQILDTVGLTTAYNIVSMYLKVPSFLAPYNFKGMAKMLKKYIDEGKLGMSSGEGFYKY